MSGGNCPETPRQKMIGMMYLFLTAMLALNVSGDLLNAFVLVDDSIKQTIKTVEGKNKILYYKFEKANNDNPAKVEESYKNAVSVSERADAVFNQIQTYKTEIVQTADGPEATPDNYLSKDNQDVASQVMLVEKGGERAKNLRKIIGEYRDYLVSLIDVEDTFMISTLKSALNTDNPPPKDNVVTPWENVLFEHLPMAANIALLSKMQGDVRNCEADVINYLYNKIDEGSFKFNEIVPLILPKSNYIIKGNEYKADIMLAAYDNTLAPEVKVDGAFKTVENGRGKYSVVANSVGTKKYTAEIFLKGPDGSTRRYETIGEYEVAEPSVVVSATKMNVLYEGVENPVEISAAGVSASSLDVRVDNNTATYKRVGDKYVFTPKPGFAGGVAKISVHAKIGDRQQRLGGMDFRIKRVPNPIAMVAGLNEGSIKKTVLMAQSGVFAEMGEDFDFDLTFKVTGFTVSTVKNGFLVDATSKSAAFTDEQKELLKGVSRGSKIYVENIRAVGPGGDSRKLGSISLTID
jgi:gliding motility-associated protein GldM